MFTEYGSLSIVSHINIYDDQGCREIVNVQTHNYYSQAAYK
jgi:hypothetical protein